MTIALAGSHLAHVKEGNHLIYCEYFMLLTEIPTFEGLKVYNIISLEKVNGVMYVTKYGTNYSKKI